MDDNGNLLQSLSTLISALDAIVGSCAAQVQAYGHCQNRQYSDDADRRAATTAAGTAVAQCLARRERRTALLLERCAQPWAAYQASMRAITDGGADGDDAYAAAQKALVALTLCGRRKLADGDGDGDGGGDTAAAGPPGSAGTAMLRTLRQHGKAVREAAGD